MATIKPMQKLPEPSEKDPEALATVGRNLVTWFQSNQHQAYPAPTQQFYNVCSDLAGLLTFFLDEREKLVNLVSIHTDATEIVENVDASEIEPYEPSDDCEKCGWSNFFIRYNKSSNLLFVKCQECGYSKFCLPLDSELDL